MRVAAIIAAGGVGTRIGGSVPKQFADLGDGTMMLWRSIDAVARCRIVDEIVVALPASAIGSLPGSRPAIAQPISFVAGGARRQDSVCNALDRVSPDADLIVIHDAARPFVTPDLVERVVRVAYEHGAAIAALPVIDTVKQSHAEGQDARVIKATLPRQTIFLAQTPQAFRRDLLTTAMAAADGASVTDEATLIERSGHPVHLVEGEPQNIKVTTPADLDRARNMIGQVQSDRAAAARIGTGYDLHRLVPDRPLILAGVRIPFERGLIGHSDADIVCHAITDAVLGAAGLGDIGRLFPDSAAKWKDADSLELLKGAMELVHAGGYRVENVDVTVIAEKPRLVPHLDEMRANLARALAVDVAAVSIKGKTNEGVGAIGRGEAMACHAVALLVTDASRKRGNTER
jgi:2-C-methyl-D-erythritol 4-phosphate cytidylyltransferase/2-C-methyl-D-erythritol 2,4-cyclodiphosphate synthase